MMRGETGQAGRTIAGLAPLKQLLDQHGGAVCLRRHEEVVCSVVEEVEVTGGVLHIQL